MESGLSCFRIHEHIPWKDEVISNQPAKRAVIVNDQHARATRFGMISVADWAGAPISAMIEAKAKPQTEHVIISGFDDYPKSSMTSVPGRRMDVHFEAAQGC